MSNSFSLLSLDPFTPEVVEILGRLVDNVGYVDLLGKFLLPIGCNSVVMIASMKKFLDETLEIFEAYLAEKQALPLVCMHLPSVLRRLIEECHSLRHVSLSASSGSSPSSPSSGKKRRSESDAPNPPRMKKLDASKFLLLNPEDGRFWLYGRVY